MYIFGPMVFMFVYLLKWLAELFRICSVSFYWLYTRFLRMSIRLNDATELNIWPRD